MKSNFYRHSSPKGYGKRIREYWFTIFGYDCHLRFVPQEFNAQVKRINNLVDDNEYHEAKQEIEKAYKRWGCDPDLIRANTLNEFENS